LKYLVIGPPGSGKSCLAEGLVARLVKFGHAVKLYDPPVLTLGDLDDALRHDGDVIVVMSLRPGPSGAAPEVVTEKIATKFDRVFRTVAS
jgi:GTPase SAR1 family protein